MVDPDLEIRGRRGGWGSGHPEPLDKGGGGLQKNFFRPFGPQFHLEIRWGREAEPLPWQSATESSEQIRSDPFWAQVNSTVADLGEGPSSVLDQTEARRAEKIFFLRPASPLISGYA